MKALRHLFPAMLFLLAACCSLPERDFFALLPAKEAQSSASIMSFGEQMATVTHTLHRKGQHLLIKLQYNPPAPGYKLTPELVRQAYGSLVSRDYTESLTPYITHDTDKTMQLRLPASCFRHSGGPWDYSLRLNFTAADSSPSKQAHHTVRLYSACPEPGALRSNPYFFDKTYPSNKKSLQELQQAALNCASIRLFTHHFHTGRKTAHSFSPADVNTLRGIIARLQPVSTRHAMINPTSTSELQLLNADGKVIYNLSPRSIASARMVSPENVAMMGRYMLHHQDESTWKAIFAPFRQ